jgi:membrane protease subunit HflC
MSKTQKTVITIWTIIVVLMLFIATGPMVGPFYIISEGTQAVVTRFGAIVEARTQAGIYFKLPVVDKVTTYSKRILSLDGDPKPAPTKENQFVIVDTTSRWRINDPAQFYRSLTTEAAADMLLSDIIDSSVRRVIARNSLSEIVRSSDLILQRGEIEAEEADELEAVPIVEYTVGNANMEKVAKGRRSLALEMAEEARKIESEYGIELIDLVPRQIKYADELTESVYNRMIKERNQVAQRNRSRGEGHKADWMGRLENDLLRIQSEAYRQSEEIRGRADAEASAIYAAAFSKDPEFYAFWKSMESYTKSMPNFNTTLSTNMDYFDYLYAPTGRR